MVRFGPSGNEDIFYASGNKSSLQAPKWLSEKGLNAYEYSFSRGFTIKDETALLLGEQAKMYDVLISAHAPFYINFANQSEEMILKSINYITRGLELLKKLGGRHYVVHVGSCGKLERDFAIQSIKANLKRAVDIAREQGLLEDGMKICLETMGKHLQIGDSFEIIDICCIDECLVPTFDFGHINAFSLGKCNTFEDYQKIFDYGFEKLGERLKDCHIHFAKIEYGAKGEIRHLNYDDNVYGPNFDNVAKIIKHYDLSPTVICESKDKMATDSLTLKQIFNEVNCDN